MRRARRVPDRRVNRGHSRTDEQAADLRQRCSAGSGPEPSKLVMRPLGGQAARAVIKLDTLIHSPTPRL